MHSIPLPSSFPCLAPPPHIGCCHSRPRESLPALVLLSNNQLAPSYTSLTSLPPTYDEATKAPEEASFFQIIIRFLTSHFMLYFKMTSHFMLYYNLLRLSCFNIQTDSIFFIIVPTHIHIYRSSIM